MPIWSGTVKLAHKYGLPYWVVLACIGLIFAGFLLPETISGLRQDYTSSANFISELGAVDAPYRSIINFVGFPLVGLSLLLMLAFIWRQLSGALLARAGLICIAIGIPFAYIMTVIFPCDYGCPMEGSARQMIHNFAGLIEYLIGTLGFILLSIGIGKRVGPFMRTVIFAVGIIMIVSFFMMLVPSQDAIRGAWQRFADYSAFTLMIALVFRFRLRHN